MRKIKKSLMACLIAVFALTLGAGLGFMPKANTAKADSTAVNFNVVYLEGDIAENGVMQIRLNTEGQTWASYYNDKLLSELPGNVADNVTINGRTLREIENASTSTGSIRVSMQPAGSFSFIRAFIPLDMMKSSDISTIGVLGGFNFTEGDVTFTSPSITYIRVGNDMVKASDYTEKETLTSADVTISDAQLTHRVHSARGADSYMVDINVGASFGEYDTMYGGYAAIRDYIYINGKSIEEWNEQMIAEDPRFNEPSTYTYFPQNSTDPGHKDYFVKPVGFWGTSTGFRLSIFQELVATCETIEVTVGAGCEINGKVVSERISKTVWTQNVVDVTNKLTFMDNTHNANWNNTTTMYYIHTNDEACWTGTPKGGCLNECDPSDAGGGQVQMKYIYFNGTNIWDINANDNGSYGSEQGNIAGGGIYAPILVTMSTEIGSSLKLNIPNAFTNGKAGHEEIVIKKGFSVYENGTSYVVTRDIIFTNTGSGWVKEVKIDEVETEIIGAFVSGSEGDNFTFLKLSVHDYPETIDNYDGAAMSVKDFINEDNFYSKILINDSPLASRSQALINVWGNKGVMAFRTNTGLAATKITILAGCKIPSYAMLADGTMKCFVTTEDVTFVKNGDVWEVQSEVVFDLDAYKAEKIAEVETYKQGEVANEEERLEYVAMAIDMINEGTSKEDIDETIAMFKEVVDELPLKPAAPDLSEIKADAKAELDGYLAGDYEALKALDRASAVAQGKDVIEAATSEVGVAEALEDAKALVDASLARVANYVDVTAVVKVMNCYQPGGNFYLQIIIPELVATESEQEYAYRDVNAVLTALGLWDNVYVGDRSLREWGVTSGWDNVIGYNVSEPDNNIYIHCHSEEWKTSDVEFNSGIVSNYTMSIKAGALIPSQAYFTGEANYDIYRAALEMVSEDDSIAFSFKAYGETDVVDVKLAQDDGDSVYLAVGLNNNDFPTEGGHVEVADLYYGEIFNSTAYWVNVKINGANGVDKYAIYNLNEGGNGRIALTVGMPYDQINSITIPAGTIFPTYALQQLPAVNNEHVLVVVLKTTTDVTFVKMADGSWVSVANYKADALATLESAKDGKVAEDYFDNDYEALVAAYENGLAAIESADNIASIDTALENALSAINAVSTKIGVLEAAKAEISNYKAGLFREAEEAQRLEAVAYFAECLDNEAYAIEDVQYFVTTAKEFVDTLKTAAQYADEELAEVKANAREEISNYLDLANYYADEQAEIALAIEAGHGLVAAATNEEEIAQAVVDAKLALDEILTKEEVVAQVKSDLAAYKAEEGYFRAEEKAIRDTLVAEALAALEGLTDKAEIDAIVAEAKANVDALTTADEYLEAELAGLKAAAREEISAYAEGSYIPSQESAINVAVDNALVALANAKSEEAIATIVAEVKAEIDEIAASVTVVDVAMLVYISDIHYAGGNMNMFIIIPGLDTHPNAPIDGVVFNGYNQTELVALFDEFGLFDMVYLNGRSLRDWGFVGFWNDSVGFNVAAPNPAIYLHMHTDNPEYAAAVEAGEIAFTKYIDGSLAVKQTPASVDKGLLIPGYAYLNGEETSVVYRAVADFETKGEARPYDIEANAYVNVDSVAYVQEDRHTETGEFLGGYFGVSLDGDDYPAFEGEHIVVEEYIRNYVNYERILINGEPGLVDRYALYNLGENGKGRLSFAVAMAEEDMYSVTIPAGTIFPAYASNVLLAANNGNGVFVFYRTASEVTFIKTADGSWVKFEDYVQSTKDAIAELAASKEGIDCFEADLDLIANTVANANAALDNATTVAEIEAIFADASAILNKVENKDVVIANAQAELDAYKVGLFRDAEETQRKGIVNKAKTTIANATSSESVASIVASTKEAIDALKTADEYAREEIAADVAAAKAELESYKAEDGLYREEEVAARLAIIEEANALLDNALSIEEVEGIVANAKAAIDELKTDEEYINEEILAVAKNDALATLNTIRASIDLTLYSEDNIAAISELFKNTKDAIELAATEEEIADILAQFEADLEAIPQGEEEESESESETESEIESTPADEESDEESEEEVSGGCFGGIGGASSVFALLSVMAVAVLFKKKR